MCEEQMTRLIQNLCNENKWLNDMYVEIRDSPLAAEIKQQYEDTIADWKGKFADLQRKYDSSLDTVDALRAENEKLQKT